MRKIFKFGRITLAGVAAIVSLGGAVALADNHGKTPPLHLATTGAYFVNGETVEVANPCIPGGVCQEGGGQIRVQQVRVDFMEPEDRRDLGLVMITGLGVRATAFTGTLDGGEGWAQFFARRNFATYVAPQSNVLVAGFNPNGFNTAKLGGDAAEQPPLFHWQPKVMWPLFGFGPSFPELYPDTRFDMDDDLNALLDSVSTADFSVSEEQRIAGIASVVKSAGQSILLTHSQSGPAGFEVAKNHTDLVKAHISIEPIGCKVEPEYAAAFKDIPVLTVFADRIADRGFWVGWAESCQTFTDNVNAAGGNATMISLPDDKGIKGNTHFMMVENNSDELAQIVLDWIEANVK